MGRIAGTYAERVSNLELGVPTSNWSPAWTAAPAAGNVGFLLLGVNENNPTFNQVAVTTPPGWTPIVDISTVGNHQHAYAYGRELTGGADDTPNIVTDIATNMIAYLIERDDIDATALVDRTATAESETAVVTFTTGTTAVTQQPGEVAMGFYAYKFGNNTISAPNNSFNLIDQYAPPGDLDLIGGAWVEKDLSATGTQECSVTSDPGRRYAGLIFTVRKIGGGNNHQRTIGRTFTQSG